MSESATTWREAIRQLYYGNKISGKAFRCFLGLIDLLAIIAFILAAFLRHGSINDLYDEFIQFFEMIVGLLLFLDFISQLIISGNQRRFLIQPVRFLEIIVIASLIEPSVANLGFLRLIRLMNIILSYFIDGRIQVNFLRKSKNQEILFRIVNLISFIIVISEIVYINQFQQNENIKNFSDSIYFTIVSLSTTGYGDIVLVGEYGRWLSIIILAFGATLFIQLAGAIFSKPQKKQKCARCGLDTHDLDAQHCKRCGNMLKQ